MDYLQLLNNLHGGGNNSIKELLKNEYINYMYITLKLYDIPKKLNIIYRGKLQNKYKFFDEIQFLLEDLILHRINYIKKPPYNSYISIIEKNKDALDVVDMYFVTEKKYNLMKIEQINKYKDSIKEPSDEELKHINTNLKHNYDRIGYLDKIKEKYLELHNINYDEFKNIDDNVILKVEGSTKYLYYNKLKVPLDNRLEMLLRMANNDYRALMLMLLRYFGFGLTGQHCSIPDNVYSFVYKYLNVKGEGFASPLNSKLISKENTVFCSLFEDTDKIFKSVGPFSKNILIDNNTINWLVNPPYMENILGIAYNEVISALSTIKTDMLVIFVLPRWNQDPTYIKLSNNESNKVVYKIEPLIGEHYMDCDSRVIKMNGVVNCMFFITNSTNEEYLDNIGKRAKQIIKLWDTLEPSDNISSNIQHPTIISTSNKN